MRQNVILGFSIPHLIPEIVRFREMQMRRVWHHLLTEIHYAQYVVVMETAWC